MHQGRVGPEEMEILMLRVETDHPIMHTLKADVHLSTRCKSRHGLLRLLAFIGLENPEVALSAAALHSKIRKRPETRPTAEKATTRCT